MSINDTGTLAADLIDEVQGKLVTAKQQLVEFEEQLAEIASLKRAIRSASDHLKSYRHCDDLADLQHEVGMVITTLDHA